jgi:sec-independent protein translocase protein TatA
MPFNLGGPELILLLVVVLIVFGAGKLPSVFGQLGKGVRTFREETEKKDAPLASTGTSTTTAAGASKYCSSCGKPNDPGAKFCASCGTPLAA